ncbi:MAG: 2-dehydro-3-deoxygluconokinase [Frondihabitans sp.]|nr:2-dehydro-3-deoxygluconokinase [Frondihabitans sp.]
MKPAKVATVGEALTVLVPVAPGPLDDADVFSRGIGGAELNVAVGLASRGIPTALLTRVGGDGFGRHVVAETARQGVDVSAIEVDAHRRTGLYIKEVGSGSGAPFDLEAGASRMLYYRSESAGSRLSPAYLERPAVRAALDGATLIHLTGITPALSAGAHDLCLALTERRADDCLLSFDVNWRPALWFGREAEGIAALTDLASRADVVLLGASEATTLFGTADPDAVRSRLAEPRILVLKNDANAAIAFDGSSRVEVPAHSVDVVEAIGAGDAFAAGFLAALVSGADVRECLVQAHRLAVVALSSRGDHVGSLVPDPPRLIHPVA